MSFRYDMKNNTSQLKAIVDSVNQAEYTLMEKQKIEVSKPDYMNKNIWGYKVPSAIYEEVSFYKDAKPILELRVSLVAIFNESCGLKDLDIYRWLWDTGNLFVHEIEEDKGLKLMIRANDVKNGILLSSWLNLGRE